MFFHTGSRCSGSLAQDVVFVIDASDNFYLAKEFAANIVTDLIRNSPRSAFGMILFERHAYIEFNLQTYTNLSTLLSAISELSPSGIYNDIPEALRYFISTVQDGTLRLRHSTSKLVIFITSDGNYSHSAALSAATTLHTLNTFDVFAIGEYDYRHNLQAIASRPDYAYTFTTRTRLPQIRNKILSQVCNCKFAVNIVTYVHTYLCISILLTRFVKILHVHTCLYSEKYHLEYSVEKTSLLR